MYIRNHNPKALEVILEEGADPDVLTDEGIRPIELAIRYDEPRAIKALITAGCLLTEVNQKRTPVSSILELGNAALTAALFKD